jgi:hypothetical protein
VRGLAIRARSTALAVLASIMIVLPLLAWPFCLALELGNWLRFNPAQRLLALPSVPFASHAPLMDVLVNGLRGEAIVVGYTPALALLLLTLMLVKLLIEQHRLLRVRASDAGKTPASSHP